VNGSRRLTDLKGKIVFGGALSQFWLRGIPRLFSECVFEIIVLFRSEPAKAFAVSRFASGPGTRGGSRGGMLQGAGRRPVGVRFLRRTLIIKFIIRLIIGDKLPGQLFIII